MQPTNTAFPTALLRNLRLHRFWCQQHWFRHGIRSIGRKQCSVVGLRCRVLGERERQLRSKQRQ